MYCSFRKHTTQTGYKKQEFQRGLQQSSTQLTNPEAPAREAESQTSFIDAGFLLQTLDSCTL